MFSKCPGWAVNTGANRVSEARGLRSENSSYRLLLYCYSGLQTKLPVRADCGCGAGRANECASSPKNA